VPPLEELLLQTEHRVLQHDLLPKYEL